MATTLRTQIYEENGHTYYNITIKNEGTTPILAKYLDIRDQPIILNASDYTLSIIRFSIPISTIPIIFWATNADGTADNTKYSVTLSYGGTDSQAFLIYTSNNAFGGRPSIYSYQHFLDILNTAYDTAFAGIVTSLAIYNGATTYAKGVIIKYLGVPYVSLVAGNVGHTPDSSPTFWQVVLAPYMTLDHVTQLFSLWVQQIYNPVVSGAAAIEIYMGGHLFQLFENFNMLFYGFAQPLGKDFKFIIADTHNNIPTTPTGYYQFSQELAALGLFEQLRQIVYLTGSIPVKTETIPGNTPSNGNNTSNSFRPILTDFEPDIENLPNTKYLQYFPQGPYRRVDLKGRSSLNIFDIIIYYQTTTGIFAPLTLAPGEIVTTKFLFEKNSSANQNGAYN